MTPTPMTQPNTTVAVIRMFRVPLNDSVRKPRGEITGISLKMTKLIIGMAAISGAPIAFAV